MAKKEKEIKIKIKKSKRDKLKFNNISGPRMNDIREKSSRWNKLPVKNIVKIKSNRKSGRNKKSILVRLAIALVFVLILLISICGYWYFQYSIAYSKVARIMPAESAIFGKIDLSKFIEINGQDQALALDGRLDFTSSYFINQINQQIFSFSLDFDNDIKNVLGRYLAFSYIKNGESSGFVFVNQVSDPSAVVNLTEQAKYKSVIEQENYEGYEVYHLSEKDGDSELYLTLLGDLLTVSRKRACVVAVIDTYQEKRLSLRDKDQFQQGVPVYHGKNLGYIYLQPQDISEVFNNDNNIFRIWDATTYDVDSAFLSFKERDGGVLIEASLNSENFKSRPGISKELLEYIPSDTSGLIAGQNLSQDFSELREDFAISSPELDFYLSDLLRKIEEQARVNEEDITKFFSNEFLLSFDYVGEKFNYNLITSFADQAQAESGMQIFEEAVSNYYGNLYPKKQPMVLSDGSEAMELLPDPESFPFKEIDFEGKKARGIDSDQLEQGVTYVLEDNIAIISSSLGSLKKIASVSSENDKLINKRFFNLPYSQVENYNSGNLLFFDNQDLQDYFKFDSLIGKSLSLFDTFAISAKETSNKLYLKGFLYLE